MISHHLGSVLVGSLPDPVSGEFLAGFTDLPEELPHPGVVAVKVVLHLFAPPSPLILFVGEPLRDEILQRDVPRLPFPGFLAAGAAGLELGQLGFHVVDDHGRLIHDPPVHGLDVLLKLRELLAGLLHDQGLVRLDLLEPTSGIRHNGLERVPHVREGDVQVVRERLLLLLELPLVLRKFVAKSVDDAFQCRNAFLHRVRARLQDLHYLTMVLLSRVWLRYHVSMVMILFLEANTYARWMYTWMMV